MKEGETMDIIKYISKNPDLAEMYQTLQYSFYLDTLTPEQIVFFAHNPEEFDKYQEALYEKVKAEIKTRLNKTFGLEARSFGKILQRSVKKTEAKAIPSPDYNIHIPYNVKEREII